LSSLPQDGELNIEEDGIGGLDPRTNASAEKGRAALNILVKNAAPKILELLNRMVGGPEAQKRHGG